MDTRQEVSVYWLRINGGKPASIARYLLHAHACVTVLAVLASVLGIIQSLMSKNAVAQIQDSVLKGQYATSGGQNDVASIVNIIFNFVFPCCLFLLVRSALGSNQGGVLQGVCILDGCCTCACGICGVISLVAASWVMTLKSSLRDIKCLQNGWTANDGTNVTYAPVSGDPVQSCTTARNAAMQLFQVAAAFAIAAGIIMLLESLTCLLATFQASQAISIMKENQVFTGAPPPPIVSSQMVVGHVVVGQPVAGPGFGTPGGYSPAGAPGYGSGTSPNNTPYGSPAYSVPSPSNFEVATPTGNGMIVEGKPAGMY